MARTSTIDDEELLDRLSKVFRDAGFAGASLAALSEASGLQRASLYHRFPDGKEQMAREVLNAAGAWLAANVLTPLRSDAPPRERVAAITVRLKEFYSGGKQACLLNMLSSAQIHDGPFTKQIKAMFSALIDALAGVLVDAGLGNAEARRRAERAVMLMQGSLVLSRGMGTTRPFKTFLTMLPDELFAGTRVRARSPGGGP